MCTVGHSKAGLASILLQVSNEQSSQLQQWENVFVSPGGGAKLTPAEKLS